MLTVGVDIGGTNIGIALVDDGHQVRAREKRPTPRGGPDEVIEVIVDAIAAMSDADDEVTAVGVGIPGAVSHGKVVRVPNLPGWEAPLHLARPLGDAVGVPVALGNDVDVGLLGEWLAGAAMGGGDVKLALGLGALTGMCGADVWVLAAIGAPLLTAGYAVLVLLRRNGRTVPHGPSMCLASAAAVALGTFASP